ncbi:cytochrome P450 [Pseudoruegeria sp. SHC-113]|uniref:cytochrome P450 n=1 Tax=Pseudoruegeria sp. SHC-113 TaxID=2855439 RepID=UPI0021BA97A8|nr:cytochrome P450 [Pseudoruegeria sp. SHC-113]
MAVLKSENVGVDLSEFRALDRMEQALGKDFSGIRRLQSLTILLNGSAHAAGRKRAAEYVRAFQSKVPDVLEELHAKAEKGFAAREGEVDVISGLLEPVLDTWRARVVGGSRANNTAARMAAEACTLLLSGSLTRTGPARAEAAAQAALLAYERLPGHPGDDEPEAVGALIVVHGLAMDTLQGLLANTLLLLSQAPALQDRLRTQGQVTESEMTEIERLCSSVRCVNRIVEGDGLSLCGHSFAAGSRFALDLVAANRDPLAWQAPEVFTPARFETERAAANLCFGQGAHRCLGVALTRRFVPAFLSSLLAHVHIAPAQTPPVWSPNWMLHAPARLPLRLIPL